MARWRYLAIAATVVLVEIAVGVGILTARAVVGGWYGPLAVDFELYQGFTRSWLAGGGWYAPEQLAGPYVIEDVMGNAYPPTLLYLTVPFALGLPALLWWLIPLGLIAAVLWRSPPAWWAWPVLAATLAYPRTWTPIVTGNPSMWAIAFAVAGVAWGWPAVGAALKLTFAPLALIGIRRRAWWIAAGVAIAAAVPFGTLWFDYATALVNASSARGVGYILGEWPIALGLLAVAASGSARRPGQEAGPGSERSPDRPRDTVVAR
jgi:hypothetical protein